MTPTCRSPATARTRSTRRSPSAARRCWSRPWRTSPGCVSTTTWASGSAGWSAWSTRSAGCTSACPPRCTDSDSGVNLKAGCQNLNGTQALAFVRDRHSFADEDLQRIEDQRAFLKALLDKATSPGVYLNPFTALPFGSTAASSISVDQGTHLYDLVQAALALRNPQTGTVPIANANYYTSAGDAVLWNQSQALELFNALKNGQPVPAGLLTGTKVG